MFILDPRGDQFILSPIQIVYSAHPLFIKTVSGSKALISNISLGYNQNIYSTFLLLKKLDRLKMKQEMLCSSVILEIELHGLDFFFIRLKYIWRIIFWFFQHYSQIQHISHLYQSVQISAYHLLRILSSCTLLG